MCIKEAFIMIDWGSDYKQYIHKACGEKVCELL